MDMKYWKLCQKCDDLYPINFMLKWDSGKNHTNYYKTKLVHCEYFFGKNLSMKHNQRRFDLVIFDETDVKSINNHWLTKRDAGSHDIIKLKHVVEVKLELGGGGPKNRKFDGSLSKKDIDKLIEFRKTQEEKYHVTPSLYFIYTFRWPTKDKIVRAEIMDFVKDLKDYCKENDIHFFKSVNFLI
jgi:hypothetical protein